MKEKLIAIQNEVIAKYGIDICDGSKCKSDWGRTHAHIKERRVCKWKQADSINSTFTLFHEIGHIENNLNHGKLRRAEAEYYATIWAIDRFNDYGIEIPLRILFTYQRYILLEKARGVRRGGSNYDELNIYKYAGHDTELKQVYDACDPDWKCIIADAL